MSITIGGKTYQLSFPKQEQQLNTPSSTSIGTGLTPATSQDINALDLDIHNHFLMHVGVPILMMKIGPLYLNNATDGTILAQYTVPNNSICALREIDIVYTPGTYPGLAASSGAGSFRFKCLETSAGSIDDFVEDTSTNYHSTFSGGIICGPKSIYALTQGVTNSTTRYISGRVTGTLYATPEGVYSNEWKRYP